MNKFSIGDDDRMYYAKLLNLNGKKNDFYSLNIRHPEASDYIKSFYNSRHAICMRYHSICLALATDTPFVAIDYTNGGKSKNLLSDLGLLDLYIDVKNVSVEKISERLKRSEEIFNSQRDLIHNYLNKSQSIYSELFNL